MRTKILLFFVFTITLLAIATVITLLFNSAPDNLYILISFYGSIMVSVAGIVFFIFYGIAFYNYEATPPWQITSNSIRYSILAAIFVALILLLSSHRLLNWFTSITMLLTVIAAELLWRRRKQTNILR